MRALDAQALLFGWERGRHRHPLDRALLLYSITAIEDEPDSLADRPLGQRNAALLRLHEALFGDALASCTECPRCGEQLEFRLSAAILLAQSGDGSSEVEVDGLRFRLPTTRDLARVARESDTHAAAERLLLSLLAEDQTIDARAATALGSRLATALEQADPRIDFAVDLNCPACRHGWTASFDVAAFLWDEIDVRSRRLLDEVHLLACAYGWPERQILSLSQARRSAYLDRVIA